MTMSALNVEACAYKQVDTTPAPVQPSWKFANPAPLGLCGFALTTFVLSMINAGAIVSDTSPKGVVLGLALFYGGFVQLLAGMWEFVLGNAYGATAFSSYGAFWMSFAALFMECFNFLAGYASTPDPNDLRRGLGIYLLAWSIFSFLMMIASHRKNLVMIVLFLNVWLAFLMLSIGEFTESRECTRAGGAFGIIAAALAWYAAYAALFNEQPSFIKLPMGEMDPIYRSIFGDKIFENDNKK